jgi:hypothetical protein
MIPKTIIRYVISSIFLFIFQVVYHQFSHGVVSPALRYVWIVPILGLIIWIIVASVNHSKLSFLYHAGIVILINGFILQGILEIAGSDSPYIVFYFIVSFLCIIVALARILVKKKPERRNV